MNGLQDETAQPVEPLEIGRDGAVRTDGQVTAPRTRGGRVRPATTRWQLGRLVRVSMEAACGFIRVPSGELIYFAMQDVVSGGGGLRAGARVRFQPAGAGIPRALHVQRI